MCLNIERIDHLVLIARDVEKSATWYQWVLGMVREDHVVASNGAVRTSVKFGNQKINIRPVDANQEEWITAGNMSPGNLDICFLTNAKPDFVMAHLNALGVAVREGPSRKRGAQGTLTSVYCNDPDGSLIEISSYE
jgi:catechol 2,3-dioxygenase-like lactoylglutathione lyase family enzyme